MPTPTSIAGALFTVKAGATTPTDYSHQVMDGEISGSANIVDEFVLGPQQVTTATSTSDTVTINGLYDGSAGFYKALHDAYKALTPLDVEIAGGNLKFAGDLHVESLSLPFAAQDSSKFSCTLRGPLTVTVVTP